MKPRGEKWEDWGSATEGVTPRQSQRGARAPLASDPDSSSLSWRCSSYSWPPSLALPQVLMDSTSHWIHFCQKFPHQKANENLNPKDITSSERNLEENFTDFGNFSLYSWTNLPRRGPNSSCKGSRQPSWWGPHVPVQCVVGASWWGPGRSPGELVQSYTQRTQTLGCSHSTHTCWGLGGDIHPWTTNKSEPLNCLLTQSTPFISLVVHLKESRSKSKVKGIIYECVGFCT